MAIEHIPFNYSIDIKWNNGGDEIINIPANNVSNIVIDYDYDNKNMPIIFLSCNISKTLVDRMIKEKSTSTIIFSIKRFKMENGLVTTEKVDHINDEFVYFLNRDINYFKNAETSEENRSDDEKRIYARVNIGLLKLSLINNNKKTINAVYREASMMDIALINTRHMKLLIEPFQNNTVYGEVLIPPKTSIAELLKFMECQYTLYRYPLRYFLDFDRTYILSSSGRGIMAKDEEVSSIFINVQDSTSLDGKIQGGLKEEEKYSFEVSGENTRYYEDTKTDSLYNNIVCIDSYGRMIESDLDIMKSAGSTKKDSIYRVDNINNISLIKNKIESSNTLLRVVKSDVNSSMFTINKQYFVKNVLEHSELDGQFLLSQKKEVFTPQNEYFVQSVILQLRRLQRDINVDFVNLEADAIGKPENLEEEIIDENNIPMDE